MATAQIPLQLMAEQFQRQSSDLACELFKVLQEHDPSIGVTLHALMLAHRHITAQLPPQTRGALAVEMTAYAGELLDSTTQAPH